MRFPAAGALRPGFGPERRPLRDVIVSWIDRLKIRYRPVVCPFQELLAFVRAGDRVCDVGCGSGQLLLRLKKATSARKLVGLEIDQRLVRNATALIESDPRAVPYELRVYDGMEFPEAVKDCNLVYLVDVLHHVPGDRQQMFLNRLHEVMAVGTQIVLKDINRASVLVVCNKLHDLVFSGSIGCERSLSEARGMCETAGFRVIATFTTRKAVFPHYFLVIEKMARHTLDVLETDASQARQPNDLRQAASWNSEPSTIWRSSVLASPASSSY